MLKMNPSLDGELKTPMGSLFSGPEDLPEVAMTEAFESLTPNHGSIIAVGDVSVATLLDMEVVPEVNDDNDDCGGDPGDGFTFSAGDGNGGKAKEGP